MNSQWSYEKIGDVCTVERGGSPRPIDKFITEDANGINWIKIGDTSDSMYITETAQKIIPEGMKKSRYVQPGDFLLSNSMSFGRPYILAIDGCIHGGWLVLRDDKELFDKRFLYYYLSSKPTYEKFKSMAVGGVVNNLNSEMVRGVTVPVPSKDEQSRVADLLDRIKKVIDSRKGELKCLDELIKARFVELFGDPVEHLDNGETVRLDTIADRITVGFVGEASNDYVDDGVPYLRTQNVRVNHIDLSGLIYVTENFHQRNEKSIIHPGDVVISRVGVNRGMAAVIPDSLEEANIANCLIVGKPTNVNPFYLAFYMNMSFGKRPQFGASVGSAQGVVNTSILKKWEVYLPTRDLQEEFYQFAQQIDKSKVAVQKALDEAQLLFDSLMQEYFG